MIYKPVLTKADFVRRYAQGEFGNRSPTWETLDSFQRDGYRGLVHVRNGRVVGGKTHYNTRPEDVARLWQPGWIISAMIPPDVECGLLLQGEVTRTVRGLSLYYSRQPKPQRIALAEDGRSVFGVLAVVLLREAMCSYSYEWLEHLLDAYPNHVIEFSTYSQKWGTLYPLYNTVFWEVRAY